MEIVEKEPDYQYNSNNLKRSPCDGEREGDTRIIGELDSEIFSENREILMQI